jgi:hypothetical protein
VTIEQLPPDLGRWVSVLGPARQLAEVIAGTDFVPKAMRGNADMVTAAIMYGDELGLGPMQSLAGLDVVEGKPRPSAELARALILREGHTLTVHDATGTRVRVSGLRAGRPETERVTIEWTLDMARAAGLVSKSNWRAYPRAMLMARATGDLARILFPDVIKGLGHLAETEADAADLEGWAGPETSAPMAPPRPPAIQRKARPRPVESAPLPEPAEPPTGLPALAPETDPGAEVTPDEDQVPDAARRAMFAAMGKALGPNAQRAERLALSAAIVGRPVKSSTDLGRSELGAILTWLEDYTRGRAIWTYDPVAETGFVSRRPAEEPPRPPEPDTPLDPWVAHDGPPPEDWKGP